MSESLLQILTMLLLALVYLFFFRVLRAVWAELRPPPPPAPEPVVAPAAASAPPAGGRKRDRRNPTLLRVTAPAGLRGRTYTLVDETTVGRAPGCAVTIDDSFASQVHARVFRSGGQVLVEDLGSTNGTYLNDARLEAPSVLRRGDLLRVGETVLEAG